MVAREDKSDAVWDDRISAYGRLVESQRRLHRIFDRSLRANVGMSIVWYEALLRLARSPEGHMTVNEVGEALDLTSGGATRLVDRLEAQGFVQRVACPTDRRVWWVALTEAGRDSLDRGTQVHLGDLDDRIISQLDPKELEALNELLSRIRPASNPSEDA